jgi:hypothetical protein
MKIGLRLIGVEPRRIEILEQRLHRRFGALGARAEVDGVELEQETAPS